MLRLKRKGGGEVNIPTYKILAFIDGGNDGGAEVVLDGGLTYKVVETPLTIRNAMKKLESGNTSET